jgi:O-antigen ligase
VNDATSNKTSNLSEISTATAVGERATTVSAGQLLNGIVFWSLLIGIPLAVVPYGTVDAWWETTFESFVFAVTMLWIARSVIERRWDLKGVSVLLPLVVITTYCFVQAVQWPPRWLSSGPSHMLSLDHYQTYLTARKTLALTLFFGLLLIHTSTSKRLRWLVRTLIVLGLGSAIFGILRQFMQTDESTGVFILPFLFTGVGYGQFISPNAFAYLMELTIGLAAGLILGGGAGKTRILIYIAIIVVLGVALILSSSRGGLLGLACQSVFVLVVGLSWYSQKSTGGTQAQQLARSLSNSRVVRAGLAVVILVILFFGVLWIGGDNLVAKLGAAPGSAAAALDGDTRLEIWGATFKLWKNYPLTGTGFGCYFLGITRFQSGSGRLKLEQSHNDYLDIAANGGIIGLALAGWFVVAVYRKTRVAFNSRRGYQRAAALGAAAGCLAISAHSMVDFGLQVTGIAVVFAALIVVMVAEMPPDEDRRRRRRKRTSLPEHSSELVRVREFDRLNYKPGPS